MTDEAKHNLSEQGDQALDDALSRATYASPPVGANKFQITLSGPLTRIGFAEQNPFLSDQLEPRGAVLLSTYDAIEMANLILKLVEESKQAETENSVP